MENLILSAVAQFEKGKNIDDVRYYLGFNYPNATCSSIEEAIRAAKQRTELEYRRRYAARLVLHGYSEVEAKEAAEAAEIDPSDMEPEDHADDEASYE